MGLILTENLKKVGQLLVEELQNELIRQGHVNSMELIKSMEYKISINSQFVEVFAGTNLEYGLFVNEGRKAGAKKVPIQALIQWVEDKGIANNDKEITSIAYAIREAIFKEGIPTSNSFKFSEDGNRLHFVETVAALQRATIEEMVEKMYIGEVNKRINQVVKEINKDISNVN